MLQLQSLIVTPLQKPLLGVQIALALAVWLEVPRSAATPRS
jgi:hypothetical protein